MQDKYQITRATGRVNTLRKKADQLALLLKKTQSKNSGLKKILENQSRKKINITTDELIAKHSELIRKYENVQIKNDIAEKISETYESMIHEYLELQKVCKQQKLVIGNGKIMKPTQKMKSRPNTQFTSPREETFKHYTPRGTKTTAPTARFPAATKRAKTKMNSPIKLLNFAFSPQMNMSPKPGQRTGKARNDVKPMNTAIPPISIMNAEQLESQATTTRAIIPPEYDELTRRFGDLQPEEIAQVICSKRVENEKLNYELDHIDNDIQILKQKKASIKAKMSPDYINQLEGVIQIKEKILNETKEKINDAKSQITFIDDENERSKQKILQLQKLVNVSENETDPVKILKDVKQYVKNHPSFIHTQKSYDVPKLDLSSLVRIGSKSAFQSMKSLENITSNKESNEESDTFCPVPKLDLNLPKMPLLGMGGLSSEGAFLPATRGTRRFFSAYSSPRSQPLNEHPSQTIEEFEIVGSLIGKLYVDRFSAGIGQNNNPVRNADIFVLDSKVSPTVDKHFRALTMEEFMQQLFDHYRQFEQTLYLDIFNDSEIHKLDDTFLQFISIRNHMINIFIQKNDADTFLFYFDHFLDLDADISAYIARDFIIHTELKDYIMEVIDKMMDYYKTIQGRVNKKDSEEIYTSFIGWMTCFSTMFDLSTNENIRSKLMQNIQFDIQKVANHFDQKIGSKRSRAGLTALLSLGRHIPLYFVDLGMIKNAPTSLLHRFMTINRKSSTAIKVGCEFFIAVQPFVDDESLMWHTAIFFTSLAYLCYITKIKSEMLQSILSVLTSIISNRDQHITDQLQHLNFLQLLVNQIELEAFVGEKAQPAKEENAEPQIPANSKVSYLDIPKLKIPSLMPSLNLENPKLQLHFQPKSSQPMRASISITDRQYLEKRKRKPIYISQEVHVQFTQLLFATLIDHSMHRFDNVFVDPFPQVNRKPNVLYTLMCHMEGKFNQDIAEPLMLSYTPSDDSDENKEGNEAQKQNTKDDNIQLNLRMKSFQTVPSFIASTQSVYSSTDSTRSRSMPALTNQSRQYEDYRRILRLTVPNLFDSTKYSNGAHIASGAFGAVMKVGNKAVKILDKSRNEFDNPHLYEVYTEVSILEICKGDRRVTQLIDYGCSKDSYFIVMEYYPTTLRSWRKSEGEKPLGVMLRMYREFLNSTLILVEKRINHFDIKCDNVMLDVNGNPALADFGESMCYLDDHNCYSMLNKGTEWIKSPEMLSIALNSSTTSPNYDRRQKQGAGPASDVWSIGCLFFELLTGEFLFVDQDWSRFFLRVTDENQPILRDEDKKKLPNDPRIIQFIEFVLKRSVRHRPDIQQVIVKYDEIFPEAHTYQLPKFTHK